MSVLTGSGGALALMGLWLYHERKERVKNQEEKDTLLKQVLTMAAEQKALADRVFKLLGV